MNRSEASKQIARSLARVGLRLAYRACAAGVPFWTERRRGISCLKPEDGMIIPGGAEWVGPFECTLTEGLTDQFKWELFWIAGGRKFGQIFEATSYV